MGFVVGVGLVLAVVVGAVAALLLRRRRWIAILLGVATFAAFLGWSLHLVCVPIDEADLKHFDPPIETRIDTGMTGQRYFQMHEGRWHHCKPWIARALFF